MRGSSSIQKRFIAGFLLILFAGYFASVNFFTHTHVVNGVRITHSHPFSQAPDTGKHTHTAGDFQLIAYLSVIVMLTVSYVWHTILTIRTRAHQYSPLILQAKEEASSVISLRGPPSL